MSKYALAQKIAHKHNNIWRERCEQHQLPYKESSGDFIKNRLRSGRLPWSPERAWQEWKNDKRMDGWIYGGEESEINKTHPNIIDSYDSLPIHEQVKDVIYITTINTVLETLELLKIDVKQEKRWVAELTEE